MENECRHCKSNNIAVIDTRPSRTEFFSVRRRRKCMDCGYRFTTYEVEASQIVAIAYDIFRSYMLPQILRQSTEQLEAVFQKADIDFKGLMEGNEGTILQRIRTSGGEMPEKLKALAETLDVQDFL